MLAEAAGGRFWARAKVVPSKKAAATIHTTLAGLNVRAAQIRSQKREKWYLTFPVKKVDPSVRLRSLDLRIVRATDAKHSVIFAVDSFSAGSNASQAFL